MKITELMDLMNYNLSRESGKSMLGEIEMMLTDLHFTSLNKLSENERAKKEAYFEANLFTNANMFPQNIDYSSLSQVSSYYDAKKMQHQSMLQEVGKSL